MGLFEQSSSTDDFCWTAEALQQGIVAHGQLMDVEQITRTANGQGYVIKCGLSTGQCVYDYAYKNSKQGKVLTAIFIDPEVADNLMFKVKAQDKVKNASIVDVEADGVEWNLIDENGKEALVPTKKSVTTSKRTGKTVSA